MGFLYIYVVVEEDGKKIFLLAGWTVLIDFNIKMYVMAMIHTCKNRNRKIENKSGLNFK
tara:strand:+ start:1381 stop:1557 length:177 start_codon:yes stop_codon:yes gene_type:complete